MKTEGVIAKGCAENTRQKTFAKGILSIKEPTKQTRSGLLSDVQDGFSLRHPEVRK